MHGILGESRTTYRPGAREARSIACTLFTACTWFVGSNANIVRIPIGCRTYKRAWEQRAREAENNKQGSQYLRSNAERTVPLWHCSSLIFRLRAPRALL